VLRFKLLYPLHTTIAYYAVLALASYFDLLLDYLPCTAHRYLIVAMHLKGLAALCALLLPLASAKCYSGGQTGNQQLALSNLETVATALQGSLAQYQERIHCLTDSSVGTQWLFSVKNKGGKYVDTKKENIAKYLRNKVQGCSDYGGASSHNRIQYR
jgi:hypothetical protein